MAVEADRVVVELEANLANYQARVSGAGATFDKSMSQIEKGASRAEAATRRLANSVANDTGRAANASRNLGRQVADIGTQLAGGQSPFLILAQQAPQVADALADTGGKAAKLALFFAGPWGAALLAAGSIAGVFAGKLLDGGSAATKQKDQLEKLTDALSEYQRISGTAVSNDYVRIRLMEVLTARTAANTVRIRENIQAQLESARAADAANRFTGGGMAGQVGNPEVAALGTMLAKAKKDVEEARRNASVAAGNRIVADAERNSAGADSVAAAAAKVKDAQDRYAITLNNLSVGLAKGNLDQATFKRLQLAAQRRMEAVVNAPALGRQADAAGRKQTAADRAQAAEARRAEQARLKSVRDEDAFQTALNKGTLDLLGVRAELTADTRAADELQRQQIEQERRDRARDVAAEGPSGTRRYSSAEVAQLQALNNQVQDAKLDLVNRRESIRTAQEDLDVRSSDLTNQRSIEQASAALAESSQERLASALRLLDLEDQMERAQLEAVLASKAATDVQKQIAQKRLNTLNATAGDRRDAVTRSNAGPGQQYLASIPDTMGKLNDAFEGVAADGLKSLTDGIADAITHAHSLADVFHDVAGQIIADLVKIAVQKAIVGPIGNALFGAAGGGKAGLLSGIFGRASGGQVNGGQMYRVNEAASPGRVEGFRPQGSGTIIPLGQMAASPRASTTIVQQSFTLDARYGITTPELIDHVNAVGQQALLGGAQLGRMGGASEAKRQISRPGLPRSAG